MPPNHRAVHQARQFDGDRYRAWARKIGENTQFIVERLLNSGAVEEQGYKACMGVLQFSKTHGEETLEAACARARAIGSCNYTTIKNILKNRTPGAQGHASISTPAHENIRGSAYYR